MATHEEIVQAVRIARVRARAERAGDPRTHPDAKYVPDEVMAELLAVARSAPKPWPGSPEAVRSRRRRRRVSIRNAADHGARIPSGSIPVRELAECFSDAELRDLLRRRDEGEARAREAARAREERHEVEREMRRIENEKQARERARIEKQAKERLGL